MTKICIYNKSFFYLFLVSLLLFTSCVKKHEKQKGRVVRYSGSENIQNIPKSQSAEKKTIPPPRTSSRTFSGPEIFEKYNTAVFMIFTSDGLSNYQGSGFFISPQGIAVSNYHVFQGTTIGKERIRLSDGTTFTIRNVIKTSQSEDLIIFQLESNRQNFNFIPIAAKSPKVGEKVFAIGSPLGLENTFSSGEISQRRENNMLQISVPIDHGSSGGALINEYGEAIGITTGGLKESGANLNFAIDIKVVEKYLK